MKNTAIIARAKRVRKVTKKTITKKTTIITNKQQTVLRKITK